MASVIKTLSGFVLLMSLVFAPPIFGFYLIGLVLRLGGFQGFTPRLTISFGAACGILVLFYMLEVVIFKLIKREWKKTTSRYSS